MEKNCAFCEPKNREPIAENREFFVRATYGMMEHEGYVLLVPKAHVSCYGAMSERKHKRFEKARDRVVEAVKKNYGKSVILEHGITGQTMDHAHLHIVPEVDFDELVAETESRLNDYNYSKVLVDYENEWEEKSKAAKSGGYLYIGDPKSKRAVIFRVAPAKELEMVLRKGAAKMLGDEELADWRKSRATPELAKIDDSLRKGTAETLFGTAI